MIQGRSSVSLEEEREKGSDIEKRQAPSSSLRHILTEKASPSRATTDGLQKTKILCASPVNPKVMGAQERSKSSLEQQKATSSTQQPKVADQPYILGCERESIEGLTHDRKVGLTRNLHAEQWNGFLAE